MSDRSRSELLLLGTIADWAYNDKLLIDEKVKIGVTPGHVFLCGAGRFQGRHVPLIDILRDDGAVVRQDGSLMRASTGCVVGSDGDRLIEVVAADGTRGHLRAGMRLPEETGEVTVSALIARASGNSKVTPLPGRGIASSAPRRRSFSAGPATTQSPGYRMDKRKESLA